MMPFLQPSINSLPLLFLRFLHVINCYTTHSEHGVRREVDQKKKNPSYQDETRRECHLNHHASNELRTTTIPFNSLFWKESFELELTGMLTLLSFFFCFFLTLSLIFYHYLRYCPHALFTVCGQIRFLFLLTCLQP